MHVFVTDKMQPNLSEPKAHQTDPLLTDCCVDSHINITTAVSFVDLCWLYMEEVLFCKLLLL